MKFIIGLAVVTLVLAIWRALKDAKAADAELDRRAKLRQS